MSESKDHEDTNSNSPALHQSLTDAEPELGGFHRSVYIAQMLELENVQERIRAVEALAEIPLHHSLAQVMQAYQDEHASVVTRAGRLLLRAENTMVDSVLELIRPHLNSEHYARRCLSTIICYHFTRDAVLQEQIIERLIHDRSPNYFLAEALSSSTTILLEAVRRGVYADNIGSVFHVAGVPSVPLLIEQIEEYPHEAKQMLTSVGAVGTNAMLQMSHSADPNQEKRL